ncbi:MAG TPA: DUF4129 domain-containing protein [Candidatus Limnocylindria bacterium]|nr:DUF4129 domain-containing protein [Candidatus Limnocylindria bacterium]
MRRGSAQTTIAALLVARGVIEAVLFAAILVAAQVLTGGERPISVVTVVLALTGAGIVLASILRDARADRQNTAIALGAMAAAAALGVSLAPPHPDGVAILTRIVLFGIVGEAFVWRNLTVARSLARWSDARNAGFAAIGAVAVAALLPASIDRTGLVVAGLAATAAAGVALSLARSAEELALAGREALGDTGRTTASGTAILLAILSVIGAIFAPLSGELLRRAGETAAPVIGNLLYGTLLALGYVAELFVNIIRSLFRGGAFPQIRPPFQPLSPEEEAEALRQIEATRPYVTGVVEIVIAAIALLVVVILVDRMARERRQTVPDGATLDREASAGEGIGAFLAGLLPRRARRPRAPRDDGTPAGALRAMYWRYLTRGDATGVPWRAAGETPAEHHQRSVVSMARNAAATPLVRAFEDLRYGERDPDPATLDAARRGLATVEDPG